MPVYEYQARDCRGPADCPRRFAYRQGMGDPPVVACSICGVALERVLSSFSAGGDLAAHSRADSDLPIGSVAPPPTVQNIFGGGLGIQGCGHGPLPTHETSSGKESS